MADTMDERQVERLLLPAVLLIEDDPNLGAMTQEMLDPDYRVDWASSAAEAKRLLCDRHYDALIVDRRLPDGDGLDIVRTLRATGLTTPALVLTALSAVDDIVEGLDGGANDYVTKPYSFRELLARIRAVMRRNQAVSESAGAVDDDIPLVCGDIAMQVGQHQVSVRGETVFFPLKEFELLEYLMQNKGRVMTRHQLIDRIWGSDYVGDTKTLDVHVKRVRSKIEVDPAHPRYLTTVRGLGYKIDEPAE